MPNEVIRIFSDLHYGDRSSRVRSLPGLLPLFDRVSSLVLNGDTIDTRPSRTPGATEALRAETLDFFRRSAPPTTFLTGNHDANISSQHTLDLAGGEIFLTHGDIIFEDLVPWGQDAPLLRRQIADELARLPPAAREELDPRMAVYRRVAAAIPQRHQSERNKFKYAVGFLKDTVWPPLRVLRVLRAWQRGPGLAAELTRRYRPQANFIVFGHIHRPGIWRLPNGITAVNTGAFGPPVGPWMADVSATHLTVRNIVQRGDEFHPGRVVGEFPLGHGQ